MNTATATTKCEPLSLRISGPLYKALKKIAKKENRSMNYIAGEALTAYAKKAGETL